MLSLLFCCRFRPQRPETGKEKDRTNFNGSAGRENGMRSWMMTEEGRGMSIRAQAEKIGFQIVGELTRCMGMEPSHLYRCYYDEACNKYILHRGILTIVAADGSVY